MRTVDFPIQHAVMNVTFSTAQHPVCGVAQDGSTGVTISIANLPTEQVCLDLDDIFTHPNLSHVDPEVYYPEVPMLWQGANFTSINARAWQSTANYSNVWFQQPLGNATEADEAGRLVMYTWSGRDCMPGPNPSDGQYYSWDCASANGSCSSVPYDVRSISVRQARPGIDLQPGTGQCHNAALLGQATLAGAVPSSTALLVAVVAAIVVCAA